MCIDEFNDTEIIIGKNSIPIGQSYKTAFLKRFNFCKIRTTQVELLLSFLTSYC